MSHRARGPVQTTLQENEPGSRARASRIHVAFGGSVFVECEVFWGVDELRHLSAADAAGAYEYVNPGDRGRGLIFMDSEIEKNIVAARTGRTFRYSHEGSFTKNINVIYLGIYTFND